MDVVVLAEIEGATLEPLASPGLLLITDDIDYEVDLVMCYIEGYFIYFTVGRRGEANPSFFVEFCVLESKHPETNHDILLPFYLRPDKGDATCLIVWKLQGRLKERLKKGLLLVSLGSVGLIVIVVEVMIILQDPEG